MKGLLLVAVMLATFLACCQRASTQERSPDPRHLSAGSITTHNYNAIFGSNRITTMSTSCAGRIRLIQGSASVNDSCFTGDTNVVVCTDSTSVSAVKCTSSKGFLSIEGNSSDEINYARVK
jgi:hypothetical protein